MSEIFKNLDLNNIEGEEWRDIPNYEGLYQVSNMGRIKSLRDKYGNYREKILSQYECSNGYLYVLLYKEGKRKNCSVHRLVGNAFLDNPSNLPCFNHKNEIKTDNRVENLEPCDYQYNNTFGSRTAKAVEKQSKRVYQYTKDYELVAIWESTQECSRNGFCQGNISKCCRGKLKQHKGFIWSYTHL